MLTKRQSFLRSLALLTLSCALAACGDSAPPGGQDAAATPDLHVSCSAPRMVCGGECVDPTTDVANCGGCGKACPTGQACAMGACAVACPSSQTVCGGLCVTLTTDRDNCGACAKACDTGQLCANGGCVVTCPAGQIACGGGCVDPMTDNQHCGASTDCSGGNAGTACPTGQVCSGGACGAQCASGLVLCGGVCIDPSANPKFCGATDGCGVAGKGSAGSVCTAGQACGVSATDGGSVPACQISCPPGFVDCNGACIDPTSNPMFCGATDGCGQNGAGSAGAVCPGGQLCSTSGGGAPSCQCPTGFVLCGGACVDPSSNPMFCGATTGCGQNGVGSAGATCGPGTTCTVGANGAPAACQVTCSPGLVACGGSCIDPASSPRFCGATTGCGQNGVGSAGTACGAGTVCQPGAGGAPPSCQSVCATGQIVCGGGCVDPNTSSKFCGATAGCGASGGSAGTACTGGLVCSGGKCQASCVAPLVGCPTGAPTSCVDPNNDPANCNGCGMACALKNATAGCANHACTVASCNAGWADCNGAAADGCEVSLVDDVMNCGACGRACAGGEYCAAGTCYCPSNVPSCQQSLVLDMRLEGNGTDSSAFGNNGSLQGGSPTVAGYVRSALNFNGTSQYVTVGAPNGLPLGSSPRTLEAWVRPTGYPDTTYSGILSYGVRNCSTGQVLSLGQSGANGVVSSANWCNDLVEAGNGPLLTTGTWNHVAYVFDGNDRRLYLNGVVVAKDTPALFNTLNGVLNVGATDNTGRFFKGDIDQVKVYSNARSAAQLLDDATLVAHYAFDGNAADDGANRLDATPSNVSFTGGHLGQAASFSGALLSNVQASSFTALGGVNLPNHAFSIALWVNPAAASGTLVHVSSAANGGGWCTPFLGFDANGKAIAQIWNGSADVGVASTKAIATGAWTHLAMTWSPQNGVRLYVNGALAASDKTLTTYSPSGVQDFVTLASQLAGQGACSSAPIQARPYKGLLDDTRIYSRELTATEIALFAAQ